MAIFRLEPTQRQLSSVNWNCSTIGAQVCWVEAKDENAARWAVTMATVIARCDDDLESPIMPWRHQDHAICVEEAAEVAGIMPGCVLDSSGHLHLIEEDGLYRQ